MNKNIFRKTIILIITCIISYFAVGNYQYSYSIGDIISGADNFIQAGIKDNNITIEDDRLENMSDLLYNALLIIGIITAVIIGLAIGIKFMTGSISQKAEIKETLIPYIAGCIVIFGAFGIWKLVVTLLSKA